MKFLIATCICLCTSLSLTGQQDSSSHRFIIIGLSGTYTNCNNSHGSNDFMFQSYELQQSRFYGAAIEGIYHTKLPRVAFHLQLRYLHNRFICNETRDPRLPPSASNYYKTETLVDEHLLTCAPYFAVTTKGSHGWLFLEMGPEVSFSKPTKVVKSDIYRTYLSSPPPYYSDSTVVIENAEWHHGINRIQLGLRLGGVVKVTNSIYASAFFQCRFFGPRELIPIEGNSLNFMFMTTFSLHYRLPFS